MDMFAYKCDVRNARIDLSIAKQINDELNAGVPLPSLGFEPRGRSGGVSDRTAVEAMRRITRRKNAERRAKAALQVLGEFKKILVDTLNDEGVRALWWRWAEGLRFPDVAKKLDMPTYQCMSFVSDCEREIRPIIERL